MESKRLREETSSSRKKDDDDGSSPEIKRRRVDQDREEQTALTKLPANWPTDIGGPVFVRPPFNLWIKETPKRGPLTTYLQARYQYATTSTSDPNMVAPKAIVYAANDHDIKSLVTYARSNNLSVATRTGGHQYMGFSSTGNENVQLDLSGKLFHRLGDAKYPYKTFEYDRAKNLLRLGAALDMTPVNDGLMALGLTIPHGECMDVHTGGHCQTGGYSPLGRTHGLLVDYIRSIEIIMADGEKKIISRHTQDPKEQDIFYSTIGGSPGNIGIITHVTVEPIKDTEYPKSRGFKASYVYNKGLYNDLLQLCAEFADDEQLSQYYTLSLCVISDERGGSPDNTADTNMNPEHRFGDGAPLAAILVWASYSGKADDEYDPKIFQQIKDAVKAHDRFHIEQGLAWLERKFIKPDGALQNFWGYSDDCIMPLSQIVQSWKWTYPREFNIPFVKRNMLCPIGKNLSKSGWVAWTVDWTDRALKTPGIKVGAQFIPFSNPKGGFRCGNDGKTSEAWRDSSMFAAYDLFYSTKENKEALSIANRFQAETDKKIFSDGKDSFFKEDRRLIWAPFGDAVQLDDKEVRAKFYDTDDVYNRILKTKFAVDKQGVFSPNEFCVGYKHQKERES